MHIVLTGGAGRLARVLANELTSNGHTVTSLGRKALDITNASDVAVTMRQLRPQVIVNCSAYNDVDGAQIDSKTAFAVNAHGPRFLAEAASDVEALLVHYSTDFVFDGMGQVPYTEDASPNPLSVYGVSKLAGEEAVRRIASHYVLRVESLFGGVGVGGHRATMDYLADAMLTGRPVRAFTDRTVSPSYAADVARATRLLIENDACYGTYHCVNSGHATWCDVALEIARQLNIPSRIEPIRAVDHEYPAPRPLFCALSNKKLVDAGVGMPSWQMAVERHLEGRDAPATAAAQLHGLSR
jgi:dTDP-4-dehydrorhamnose reductase